MYHELVEFCQTSRQREIVESLVKLGSQRKTAAALDISRGTINDILAAVRRHAARQGHSPEHGMTKAVPDTHFVKGTSTLYDDAGNIKQQWVKSNIKLEQLTDSLKVVAKELAEDIRGKFKPKKLRPTKGIDADIVTAIKIGDGHLGLLAWSAENGSEDYDLKKATTDLQGGIEFLIDAAPKSERLLIVNVGDFFHANDRKSATPGSGNILDTDSRHGKVLRQGTRLLKHAIDAALKKFPQVEIINARGNHDPDSAVALNLILEAYFEKEPRVTVNRNDSKFLAWAFGKTLLVVNHGERKPIQQYEYITNRFREQIGNAEHVYVDNGHIHHKQCHEIGCATFEVWNALPPADAYHADHGYSAGRSITSVTYHRLYGEVGRNKCDIRRIRDIAG